jgi:hypothetical protein
LWIAVGVTVAIGFISIPVVYIPYASRNSKEIAQTRENSAKWYEQKGINAKAKVSHNMWKAMKPNASQSNENDSTKTS